MIRFLFKGLIRDRHRSLFPIIIVSVGVLLTTFLYSWMSGVLNDMIDANAKFDTGHLKVETRAYNKLASQIPNDLAITGIEKLMNSLQTAYPGFDWTARIKFGGLLDVPDQNGETKTQAPVAGFGINLLGKNSDEVKRLNIGKAIIRGHVPDKPGEILISDEFARRMGVDVNQAVTLLSTSSTGGMAIQNFTISGTVEFGITAMDRGAIIADLSDIQYALEMPDGAGEILGFSKDMFYNSETADKITANFNAQFLKTEDQYAPIMLSLEDQNGLREYIHYVDAVVLFIVGIFLFAMSAVLLNAGLMSGIRRYGEVGIRMALGESKEEIYKTLIYESILIGLLGSGIGTVLGLLVSLYFQNVGIDISGQFRNSTLMVSNMIRARISFTSFYIGFIPGLLATITGTSLSGIQIFKRQTASLFKELET
ncbi:MAG: FtsX-like permease family protein [Ignavibacteriaceae bacterium]|nr:FtsX-like permease family protein [Ignavibacteriaceae bacterium]